MAKIPRQERIAGERPWAVLSETMLSPASLDAFGN